MTEEPLDPVHLHEASAPGRRRGARKRGGGLWPEGYSDQTVTGFLQDRPSGIQDRAYFASREASIRMRAEGRKDSERERDRERKRERERERESGRRERHDSHPT